MRHLLALNLCVGRRTIVQLSPKPQMSERRPNTICMVVEWSDHHCSVIGYKFATDGHTGMRSRNSCRNAEGRNANGRFV